MVRICRKLELIKLTDQQIDEMIGYIKEQGDVAVFYIYGSYGTKHQTLFSDVDLAILPAEKTKLEFQRYLTLLAEIQCIGTSDDINLVDLFQVPVTLQMRILESGRILYCKNEVYVADFKESVICRYSDYEPDLRAIYQDYDAGIREEYL